MVLLARLLSRLVGATLVMLLAVIGLAAAIFCIQGDHGTVSLPALASDVHLPTLRDAVATFLGRLEGPGGPAWIAAGCGLGGVLLGLLLVTGALVPARERAVVLRRDVEGQLAAGRRALAGAARALAERPPSVVQARVRVRPRRRRPGGRVLVRAEHVPRTDSGEVTRAVQGALGEMTDSLPLRARIRPRRQSRRVA